MDRVDAEKKSVHYHHQKGFKMLTVGQPLAGKDVPKATYMSCIDLFSPNSMIDLLEKYKIVSSVKILGDFPIDANRNRFVEEAIASGSDYLFFMDMDQTFPSDALARLFEVISDERPIVSGMYFLKHEPYSPVMGRYVDWDDTMLPWKEEYEKAGFVHPDGRQLAMWRAFTYFDKTAPFKADVIGLGCVLMKTSVFKDLKAPYFNYTTDPRPDHKHYTMDEVMPFCAKMAKLGIPIYVDPRVQCGHITQIESNIDIFTNYRDSQFTILAQKNPEKFEVLTHKFIDVREEQKNERRFETFSNSK